MKKIKKLTKLGRYTRNTALIVSFFVIWGTTGALELNDISMTQGLVQYAIGLIAAIIGLRLTRIDVLGK